MIDRLRSYIPMAVLAALIFYFSFQAMIGPRGFLLVHERNATLVARNAQLADLRRERQELERRARLLRDQSLSADLLDERARYQLGVADPRDYVIRIKPKA